MALVLRILPGGVRVAGLWHPLLATLSQSGQLLDKALVFSARGHDVQTFQVCALHAAALALHAEAHIQVLMDPRAVPSHIRVQVLLSELIPN